MTLRPAKGQTALDVEVDTMTPNFAAWRVSIDGAKPTERLPAPWQLHRGTNTLEVVSVNKFGVEGVPGKVVLEVE
jgi:hypothetical protein